MFRRSSLIAATIGALLLGATTRADEVADFLERLGLTQLLAVHLEEQLEEAEGEQRALIVARLADLYAELLETVSEPSARARLEARGRALVSSLPDADAGALRLALLRGTYRTAEAIAENHRLRRNGPEDVARATDALTEIIPKLNQLRGHLETNIELMERRLSRASGYEASSVFADVEKARALYDEATFYYAWALYYQSWLNDRRDNALVAIRAFSELMGLDSFNPDPNEVSVDLRSVEPIARSILGIALCKSLTSSSATAINWLALLEHENTFEPIREEAPVWRMAIWLEHDEFSRVLDELDRYLRGHEQVPLSWLRLVAVHALERGRRDRQANGLVRYAITELAARDALDQVLDLAQRYGTEALGEEGFALLYVRGVMTYSEAREEHGDGDGPTSDSALLEQYDRAAAELEAALAEDDAAGYPDAAAACRRMIGYCRYFQGQFLAARDAFAQAAAQLQPDDEAAEALWMAIVSLDKVASRDRSGSLGRELEALMDRFLREYPSSEYAPRIQLKQALATRRASDEVVDTLLEIPENSEVFPAARRRAAQVLYRLFREASGAAKKGYARRFIDVALPRTMEDMRRLEIDDDVAADELVTRCRMLLEVALADGVMRVAAARQAFTWLEELRDEHGADLSPFEDELGYRRLLERLYANDVDGAVALADELWERDASSIWARLGARAMFNHAHRRWLDVGDDAEIDLGTLRLIDRYGGRILRETAGDPVALASPAVLAYHATVAEADRLIWQRTGDEERGRAALTLYERLLRDRPANARFLRATARLSEALGKPEQALECWRTLLAGSDVRSDVWFEAKFHQVKVLIDLGRLRRAREVLEQHVMLNPDYGPDPWGPRLKGLEQRLIEDEPAASGADDTAPAGEEGGP